ncbi:MAG: putative sulfate/molybdate transporter, partial [candidate division KSB1 bacterium]
MTNPASSQRESHAICFNRNELAGAFGDIGTSLPLIVGVALAAKLEGASMLILFGLMQIMTGLIYRMPMPVQPLKAMAALVIAQKASGAILFGAGLAIGVVMLVLSLSGLVDRLARLVPKCVIRGIQFGLGLQLATLAVRDYVQAEGVIGYALATAAFALTVLLLGNKKYPAALFVIGLGLVFTLAFKWEWRTVAQQFEFGLPVFHLPQWSDIVSGFFLLALPQIPLSLGNSVLATRQIAEDLFPERKLTVRKI